MTRVFALPAKTMNIAARNARRQTNREQRRLPVIAVIQAVHSWNCLIKKGFVLNEQSPFLLILLKYKNYKKSHQSIYGYERWKIKFSLLLDIIEFSSKPPVLFSNT